MALIEDLTNLEMTKLETLLKECLLQRPDISASIPDTQGQKDYVLWMIRTYGEQYADVTRSMLPYFTPGNTMTQLAEQLVDNPGNRTIVSSIAWELTVQDEEGYIAGKNDMYAHHPRGTHLPAQKTEYTHRQRIRPPGH